MGANIQHVRNFTDWAFWEKKTGWADGTVGRIPGHVLFNDIDN